MARLAGSVNGPETMGQLGSGVMGAPLSSLERNPVGIGRAFKICVAAYVGFAVVGTRPATATLVPPWGFCHPSCQYRLAG